MKIIVFDLRKKDWIILREFSNYKDAQKFIDNYPRFGAEYSKTIREGNWQIG